MLRSLVGSEMCIRDSNGSAGAPAIHFGDSDSGVYGDSSNGVRLTAGGSDTIVATTNGVTFPPQATALTSLTLGSQSALSKPLYFADAASVQSASILLDNSSQELRIKKILSCLNPLKVEKNGLSIQ